MMKRNRKILALVSVAAIIAGLMCVLERVEIGSGAETIGEWAVSYVFWILIGSIHGGAVCVLSEIVYALLHWRDWGRKQSRRRPPEYEEELYFALTFGMVVTLTVYTIVYVLEMLVRLL